MKQVIAKLLKEAIENKGVKITKAEIEKLIEIPPSQDFGDYAFPCFFLTEKFKASPHEIALNLRAEIGEPLATDFEDIQTQGGYINFFVNRKSLARKVLWEVINQKKNYGSSKIGKGKRTMIEFPSPNTNKPLHLGHLRNLALGESISRVLEFNDEKVFRANLYNDRGIHISKSMLAYQKWGKEETPTDKKIKPDHFVGKFYMLFNKKKTKKLEAEAQELLKKWEEKDRRTLLLWRLMTNWAIEGFKQTYKKFGIKFDVEFFESKIYKKGKKIILEGVKEGIFEKSRGGEVKINLEEEGLGEKILLRKDGTSIYIVFDLALAEMKFDKYDLDKSLYVVGNEQEYHFNVLFSILKKLGFGKKEMKHISYGLVNLPHGRMKSREGTVVDADNLIEQIRVMAEKEIKKRGKIPKTKLEKRSIVIALAAIKYMLLRIDIKKSILFNPKESVSFDGDTGPYILYSYARASSIVRKSEKNETFKIPDLEDKEIELIKKLSTFSEVVIKAGKTLNPSMIANYSYQLCKIFNEFYQLHKVIGSEEETFRLVLTESFRQVLRNALHLLGIETLEEM